MTTQAEDAPGDGGGHENEQERDGDDVVASLQTGGFVLVDDNAAVSSHGISEPDFPLGPYPAAVGHRFAIHSNASHPTTNGNTITFAAAATNIRRSK
jgi:hypothetical protein